MGEKFKVTKNVLIPRPETEELVQLCIDHFKHSIPIAMADICTGSGCIAISMSKVFPTSNIQAYDISVDALNIAKENNHILNASVQFNRCDILKENPFNDNSMDCIISNPPYVLESEKIEMRTNVLEHEPHLALFVDDNQALIFYTRILEIGFKALKNNGVLFFEINEQKGEEIKEEALAMGYANASILKDIHGKDRMVKVIKE
jgi:release factor glutamine methyltransferase